MTNNDIFKKLRVALKFRDDEIVEILQLVDFKISKSELGAFFRKEDHPNYMECGDQVLRNFLNGLVLHLRGTKDNPKNPGEVLLAMSATTEKPSKKFNEREDFKTKQLKKVDKAIGQVKYKNKKKS
jgi:energy-coupling factor transporter ATP-binding protein EcfA2